MGGGESTKGVIERKGRGEYVQIRHISFPFLLVAMFAPFLSTLPLLPFPDSKRVKSGRIMGSGGWKGKKKVEWNDLDTSKGKSYPRK